jgi:hypothetical protein
MHISKQPFTVMCRAGSPSSCLQVSRVQQKVSDGHTSARASTMEALINQHHIDPGRADNLGRNPSWIAARKGHGAALTLLLIHNGESNIGPTAPYETDNDGVYLECDVCTSRIPRTAFHFHCNLCAGGDWDVCEVCRKCGATCVETAHVLVKRTMVDGLWSEVAS